MKRTHLLTLLLVTWTMGHIFSQPLYKIGFENFAGETAFTLDSWKSIGFTVPWVNGFNQNRAYVDSNIARSGTKSLRLLYPKGGFGPSQTGGQAALQLPPAMQYYIAYWLRFDPNFSYGTTSQGGKLPGLAGGENCSGCTVCSGTNGFTARLMWRSGGKAVLYLYDMDKKELCGDDHALKTPSNQDFVFQKGKWHHVVERVKINSGTNHDGEVEVWMDGYPALLRTGLQFVNNGGKVDNFYFSTFHGGSSAAWAPVADSYIWFDDLVITTNASDIFTPLSQEETPRELITIGPSPAASGGSIFIQSGQKVTRVELADASGNKLDDLAGGSKESGFLLPKIPQGTYLLTVHFAATSPITRKIVVE